MEISLTNFTIDIVNRYLDTTNYIRLTSYNNGFSSLFSSFDENLSEQENGQYLFSFSVELFNGLTRNPYVDYLTHGRQLRLTLNNVQVIDFNITNITPIFGAKGVQYQYSCQDTFSYQWSSQSVDTSFSTDDPDLWGDNIGPKTIDQLIQKLLEVTCLDSYWSLDASVENHLRQFPNDLYRNTGSMKISLNMSTSSPFNILTQITTTFNAILKIDYESHIISVYNKEKMRFKGFNLLPGVNLSNFNYAETSDNLYNIMYVTGGEDAYGTPVSLLEPVPESLYNLFINLDYDNICEDPNALIESGKDTIDYSPYYPDFIVSWHNLDNKDYKCVYYKKYNSSTQKLYYANTNLSNAVDTSNWKNATSTTALQSLLLYYCNLSNIYNTSDGEKINIYTSHQNNFSQYEKFFQLLNKIPHYGSFLKNFDYWIGKTLSEDRALDLEHRFNVELRNLNILSTIYNNLYQKYSYELRQLISQEEEIINNIASLLGNKATMPEDMVTRSLDSFYMLQCATEEIINPNSSEISTTYFLPIAEWYPTDQLKINYGAFDHFYYETPDLADIRDNLMGKKIYYKKTDEAFQNIWKDSDIHTIDLSNNQIAITSNIDESFLVSHDDGDNTVLLYIKLEDISSCLVQKTISGDAVIQSEIDGLLFQLEKNVWTDNYFKMNLWVNGESWLENKLSLLNEKILKWRNTYQASVNKMISNFGENWNLLNFDQLQNSNFAHSIAYASLLKQIKDSAVYIGGIGTRKDDTGQYYRYPGYYTYYYTLISNKLPDLATQTSSRLALKEQCDLLRSKIKEWWGQLYLNYNDVIRECVFSDSVQLTSDSLYNAAQKQFMQYQKPTASYSTSYLSTMDLDIKESSIDVGDFVNLYQPGLLETVDPKTIVVELDDNITSNFQNNIARVEYSGHRSTYHYDIMNSITIRGGAVGEFLSNKEYVLVASACNWASSVDGQTWSYYNLSEQTNKIKGLATNDVITGVVYSNQNFWACLHGGWILKKGINDKEWQRVTALSDQIDLDTTIEVLGGNTYYSEHPELERAPSTSIECQIGQVEGDYVLQWRVASGDWKSAIYIDDLISTMPNYQSITEAEDIRVTVTSGKILWQYKCKGGSFEGIMVDESGGIYCYGTGGYVGQIVYLEDEDEFIIQRISLGSFSETITKLIHYKDVYIAITFDGNVYNFGNNFNKLWCTYAGEKDLRALHVHKNNIYIGGEDTGILYISYDTFKNLQDSTEWESATIPSHPVNSKWFIRDIVSIENNMFVMGYAKANNNSVVKNFFWLSTDLGLTWHITNEIQFINDNTNLSAWFSFLQDNNHLYFGGNGVLFHYIEPIIKSTAVVPHIIGRNLVELTALEPDFNYPNINIHNIYYNNRNLSLKPLAEHIINISKKTNTQAISLRINGVDKKLRQNQISLKIEENTLYNSLFDKLLYSIRNN